jgi:glycosyltransferase involved in cell wall biosynthesis
VRIGIDMLAVQTPGSRQRGIGRYSLHLVSALVAQRSKHQFVLYAHDGLPADRLPAAPHASVRTLRREPHLGERTLFAAIDRIARTNPDALDLLLILSPFEMHADYCLPSKPLNRLRVAAVAYDLIPFLFQENYLNDPHWAAKAYRHLQTLRQYDQLLAISEATRADCLSLLKLPPERVVNISGASDPGLFVPDRSVPMPLATRRTLVQLGIVRPFVFSVGSIDPRKNLRGLIDSFRLLPPRLRQSHQLVIACALRDADRAQVLWHAEERGVADSLVLTGEVPDETLRILYQRCAVFAFPSLYEGFGLPLLEAMHCGAAVVAGNNSSQPEVVGEAGLLAHAHDATDFASKVIRVLDDPALARSLGEQAVAQADRFRWERTAERALEALTAPEVLAPTIAARPRRRKRLRLDREHAPRPRLAVFSPWPPKGSGISDYAVRLVDQLKHRYAIDVYHDAGYVPDLGLGSHEFGCYDYRLFDRRSRLLHYRAVIYQMGNSLYHKFIYEMMLRHPGIVALHDFCLAGFQEWFGNQPGAPAGHLEHEVKLFCGDRTPQVLPDILRWSMQPVGIHDECAQRGLHLNRRVFERAESVVVHSPWCLEQVQALFPQYLERTAVIPMGAAPRVVAAQEKAATRARFDLPPDSLLCASFGILHPHKLNVETIEAFQPVAQAHPEALLLFVGHDWGLGEARRKTEELGLESRVRFLGRQHASEFADLIAVADIGIGLRKPPTNGETSASLLDLLRTGVATIVTNVATFASYPDTVVRKVTWDAHGREGLTSALIELADDPARRASLGQAAWSYVAEHHDWSQTASSYEALIERSYAARSRPRSSSSSIYRGPHRPHSHLAPHRPGIASSRED